MASKKKRRKRLNKGETSTAKRVLKFGGAVLAFGAGAALFSRSDLLGKASRYVPALMDTKKAFSKELLGKKHTAMNLYEAYNKTIGPRGSEFQKTLAKRSSANLKYNPSSAKLTNATGILKNIKQTSRNVIYEEFHKDRILKFREEALEEILKDDKFKNYAPEDVQDIVFSTVAKYKEVSDKNGNVDISFLKRRQQMYNMSDEDMEDIVKRVSHNARKTLDDNKENYNLKKRLEKLIDKTEKKRLEAVARNTRDNQWLNKIGNAIGIKNLDDKLLGSHQATLKEVMDNLEQLGLDKNGEDFHEIIANQMNIKGHERDKFINTLQEWNKLNKDSGGLYDNMIFDKNLRVKTNKDGSLEFMDLTALNDVLEGYMDDVDSSLIGRILTKGIDRKGTRNAPSLYMLHRGLKSASAHLDDAADGIMKTSKLVIDDAAYEIDFSNFDIDIADDPVKKGITFNMRHGSFPAVLKELLGSSKKDPMNARGSLFQKLDIGQTGRPGPLFAIHQWATKFADPEWGRNSIDRARYFIFGQGTIDEKINNLMKQTGDSETTVKAMLTRDFEKINSMFKTKAGQVVFDDDGIAILQETINDLVSSKKYGANTARNFNIDKVQQLLDAAMSSDRTEDIFDTLLELQANGVQFNSSNLKNLLYRYQKNAAETIQMISIDSVEAKKIPILDMEFSETNILDATGILRREILKEVTTEKDVMAVTMAEAGSKLSDIQLDAMELLTQWQNWESATSTTFSDGGFTALFTDVGPMKQYIDHLKSSPADSLATDAYLNDFRKNFNFFHRGNYSNIHEDYYSEFNSYDLVSKTSGFNSIQDVLANINNFTKWKASVKQFNAGRQSTENITSATLVTQYMIHRLSQGVENAGLALSDASTSSPLNTIKNLMLKRVFPAMAAYTAFNYVNDMSQDIFGIGITGAAANSVALLDIGARKLAYATGAGQVLDWFKRTSVIAEYWTGSTDFQTEEERAEWYKDGYSPVRKSRFWGFGSSSEFRGGDISFFQPNYLRRIHSDYKDKVIYGSNKEKWAHSIIPTPTHPFSTVRYLLDPYWLERKHMDDAPTPLTGKMFAEGSFWGTILNPTIGEVIKPQIMLPEVKKRLTGKGHDVRGIIRNINERIKRKASEYDDMLIVNGTDIRNATYVPYGNATPNTITVSANGRIRGINYMNAVQDIERYRTPDGTTYTESTGGGFGPPITRQVETGGVIKNHVDDFLAEFGQQGEMSINLIQGLNDAIKNRTKKQKRGRMGGPNYASGTPDSTHEGTYIYNNLVNEYNTFLDKYYSDKLTPILMNSNKYKDYAQDAVHSVKNLSGIYGFLGEQAFGGDDFTYRYENAGSYLSFSRGFWDMGLGGLGGGMMEIARRFFPSSDKSKVDYNPLVNNMPDWLPEKFRTGVAWTKVTKGEMRLPGKGYESLNDLHPDEFADENGYGSFDKFKILADVAPNSNEYKIWHNIVKHHIKDPELKQEIKEIEARTKRMSGNHEFYEYQYLHTGTEFKKGVVKEINDDGTVRLANDQILTMAGINFTENYNGEVHNFLTPGQHITYRVERDIVNDPTGEGVIRKAAIYTGGDNINKRLIDMGVAERDMSDTSAIGNLATVSASQEVWGAIQEVIAHARIPIVHNKLMHIETPLESFISEQVYGANFQTWDHPIEGFIKPMINEVRGQSIFRRALARGYREFHYSKIMTKNSLGFGNKATKFISGTVMATLDPMAMMGGTLNFMRRLSNGRVGRGNQQLGAWSQGAKVGGTVGDFVWAWQQADNPLEGAIAFGALAGDLYRKLEFGEFAEKVLKKTVDVKGAMGVGAAIGLGISALKNADFDKEKMFGKFMPKKYKKINEINEYYDRLEYIKYKGLYESAARRAAWLEGADIKGIFKELDKNKAKIAKLKHKAEKLLDKLDEGDSEYKAKMAKINQQIASLEEQGNQVFKGGKYTKSAVAYKKAMESTIYGLKEGATKDEILAAIPDQYKDYFQKFIDVRDKSEQKKILKYMPEYLKRPLQLAWGMELSDVESNRKYFKTHKLPGLNWRGWKPNVNLKHVKMKTVENEGMILADFGFYESERSKPIYKMAPEIEEYNEPSSFNMFSSLRLMAEMKGLGLGLTNVSIDRTNAPGLWIGGDIKQTIEERTELATNSLGNVMQSIASNFY